MIAEYPFLLEHPQLIIIGSILILVIVLVAVVLVPIAIVRTAINDNLTKTKKVLWILGEIFISPLTYIYLLFVDKNRILKVLAALFILTAIICLIIPDTRRIILAASGSKVAKDS